MKRYSIEANGTRMGYFAGKDEDEAVDSFATDAGYKSYADLLERVPGASRGQLVVTESGEATGDEPCL